MKKIQRNWDKFCAASGVRSAQQAKKINTSFASLNNVSNLFDIDYTSDSADRAVT